MTLRLILTRHAKSSWDSPLLSDHDRPLNGRGRKSAAAIGAWLRQSGYVPDQVLSSSSARTRETFDLMGFSATATFTRRLYHAGASAMLTELQTATGKTVLMLGHNPGIADFADRIVDTAPDHDRFWDYPTCATLVAAFDQPDWQHVDFGLGSVLDFVIPRELT